MPPKAIAVRAHLSNTFSSNRCVLCFKLLKNWKGTKLSPFYDIDKLNELRISNSSPAKSEPTSLLVKSKPNAESNLVSSHGNAAANSEDTIRHLIQKTLFTATTTSPPTTSFSETAWSHILLSENSSGNAAAACNSSKKICKTCHDHVVLIDYHMQCADNMRTLMQNKISKSFQIYKKTRYILSLPNLFALNIYKLGC